MDFFIGQISNPVLDKLDTLHHNLARAGLQSANTLQPSGKDQLWVLGWADSEEAFAAPILESGVPRSYDALSILRFGLVPRPTLPVINCDMPHNQQPLGSGTIRRCANGHAFCNNHNITNCAVCGQILR